MNRTLHFYIFIVTLGLLTAPVVRAGNGPRGCLQDSTKPEIDLKHWPSWTLSKKALDEKLGNPRDVTHPFVGSWSIYESVVDSRRHSELVFSSLNRAILIQKSESEQDSLFLILQRTESGRWKPWMIRGKFHMESDSLAVGVYYDQDFSPHVCSLFTGLYQSLVADFGIIDKSRENSLRLRLGRTVPLPIIADQEHALLVQDSLIYPIVGSYTAVDSMPIILEDGKLKYPGGAGESRAGDIVWLRVLVDKFGHPRHAYVISSTNFRMGFEEATIKCAMKTIFRPA